METLYCVCGEPVMNPMYDAGCRRCGRPVDFTPKGPPFTAGLEGPASRTAPVVPALIGSEDELRYADELAAGRDPRD